MYHLLAPSTLKYNALWTTWLDAEEDCNQWGGHLATVTNRRENDEHLREMKSRYDFAL